MSTSQTLVLGAIAGLTIFLGLPIGRMQNVKPATKAFLAATATGILIFLLWDVLSEAVEPVEEALTAGRDGRFLWLSFLLLGGAVAGEVAGRVHRDGHWPAQLLRGARDRPGCGRRRGQPRDRPEHRLRSAQRDRGARHLRAARGRPRA